LILWLWQGDGKGVGGYQTNPLRIVRRYGRSFTGKGKRQKNEMGIDKLIKPSFGFSGSGVALGGGRKRGVAHVCLCSRVKIVVGLK